MSDSLRKFDGKSMKHYILIEVREPHRSALRNNYGTKAGNFRDNYGTKAGNFRDNYGTKAGNLRHEITKYCETRNINAAHCIVREDRPFIYGTGERTPYVAAQDLFHLAMGAEWRRHKAEQIASDAPWDAR
jgi:hypothetical protein